MSSVTYHVENEVEFEEEEPVVEEAPPSDLTFAVRPVHDVYGTTPRPGVELYAYSVEDDREWNVVTVIPGKRIRVHANAQMLGLQNDGVYPGIKQV